MAEKILMREGRLIVPDCPVIPYIEGDGIGRDIWSVSQKVIDAAVKKPIQVNVLFSGGRFCRRKGL